MEYPTEFNDDNKNRRKEVIKNKAFLELDLCGRRHIVESNEVEAYKVDVRLKKEESSVCVFEDQIYWYTVKIFNNSYIDLYDAVFKDTLDNDIEYVEDSLKVDGISQRATMRGREISCPLTRLGKKRDTVVTFAVKVK